VRKLFVAAALVALACAPNEKPSQPQSAAATAPVPPNLLEITRGAAVVSRTAEAVLSASAVRAIDTNAQTVWINPPGNVKQSLVLSLPSRSRIDQVGLVTSAKKETTLRSAKFELSDDGEHFTDVGTYSFDTSAEPQLFRISPAVARYVRVTALAANTEYEQIGTVFAVGTPLEPRRDPSIDGAWTINDQPATFEQHGSQVYGSAGGMLDMKLDGGSDGRFLRFAWIRGRDREYGLAAISVTPDGKHLSGMVWHEEALQATQFWADDWFGEKSGARASARPVGLKPDLRSVMQTYLNAFGYFPLYALRFDDAGHLDEQESAATLDAITPFIHPDKTRFIAHELNRNPAITQTELDTLRTALQKRGVNLTGVDFVAMGNRDPRRPTFDDLTRAMYSSVEIQIRR
jgi:hypothetical protein